MVSADKILVSNPAYKDTQKKIILLILSFLCTTSCKLMDLSGAGELIRKDSLA